MASINEKLVEELSRNLIIKISKQYNLRKDEDKIFKVFWDLYQLGIKYKKEHKTKIYKSLHLNYVHLIAAILNTDEFKEFTSVDTFREHVITNSVFRKIKTLTLHFKDPLRRRISGVQNQHVSRFNRMGNIFNRNRALGLVQPATKFVIFSDHHMTENDHRHNYFLKNKSLYMDILRYYSDEGYGLIENGDVEEYTIFEPSQRIANGYNTLIDRSEGPLGLGGIHGIEFKSNNIDWDKLVAKRVSNRKEILAKILEDHRDLYDLIDQKFASKGSTFYTKITGNHDPYVAQELVDMLPKNISDNLCDALRINYKTSTNKLVDETKYFITHGHQFDASTLPQHAFALGEVYSETLGCFIQGADRIWDSTKTNQWRKQAGNTTFRNILATAKPEGNFPMDALGIGIGFSENFVEQIIIEPLMQDHEIAWEYFDSLLRETAVVNEVMTGDEYFKVRHLSETKLVEKLDYFYSKTAIKHFKTPPKVIIGHTHEPRMNARKLANRSELASHYLNSGSAGRFENLIWGIELVDGTEKIISWTRDGSKLIRNSWVPDSTGKLVKQDYPV